MLKEPTHIQAHLVLAVLTGIKNTVKIGTTLQ